MAPAVGKGWGHVGPAGSGHFVKMVHNGIEYGLMQHKSEFDLDLHHIAEIWRYGGVVRSLLDMTAKALAENPNLEGIATYVTDSGEGRWSSRGHRPELRHSGHQHGPATPLPLS